MSKCGAQPCQLVEVSLFFANLLSLSFFRSEVVLLFITTRTGVECGRMGDKPFNKSKWVKVSDKSLF